MPVLPPSQSEFFMFSLQVTISLSQTFGEAMGTESRLCVTVLLTVPALSGFIHGHSVGVGCPWPWSLGRPCLSTGRPWPWSLQGFTLGRGAPPQAFP